jgi:hypothetical protein
MISNYLVGFLAVDVTWWLACFVFSVYAMSHKGKATLDLTYNPEDDPEPYNNPVVHIRLN